MTIKEELHASDYEVYQNKPSQIDPDKKIRVFIGWNCPNCKTFHKKKLRHGKSFDCECGLSVIQWGSVLDCTL